MGGSRGKMIKPVDLRIISVKTFDIIEKIFSILQY